MEQKGTRGPLGHIGVKIPLNMKIFILTIAMGDGERIVPRGIIKVSVDLLREAN